MRYDVSLATDYGKVTYQDEAVAFIEEAYSDWFTAIYDLDTGLFCYIECDT